jgi:tetratricopeptide (TPR) repeat protein
MFLLTVCLYLPALRNDFIDFDDNAYITVNAHVRGGLTAANVRWAFTTFYQSNWHPLTWLSHQVDATLFDGPGGPHLVNAVLHAANAMLLYLFLFSATRQRWPSALCAALFAWHPLRVESVAWASERKDVLCATFFFLTLLSYSAYARSLRRQWYVAAIALFAIGLLAKPMIVTLPCLLILLDVWPLDRLHKTSKPPLGRLLLEKLPFFALAIASSVVTYQAQKAGGSVAAMRGVFAFNHRLANTSVAYARYLAKTFLPIDLAVFYPMPAHFPAWQVICSSILLLGLTSAAVWQASRRPYLLVAWCWFVGSLVPVIGLVQVGEQSIADRYTYLPCIGIALAVSFGVAELVATYPGSRRITLAAALGALVVLAAATVNQITYWHDDKTLFVHADAVTADNWVADGHIALALEHEGDYPAAEERLRTDLKIHPEGNPKARDELGQLLLSERRNDEAADLFHQAIAQEPTYLSPQKDLASLRLREGNFPEAIERYQLYLAGNPGDKLARNNLALAFLQIGDLNDAEREFAKCVELDPMSVDAECSLGRVLIMRGKLAEAKSHYRRAVSLDPQSAKAQKGLYDIQAAALQQH